MRRPARWPCITRRQCITIDHDASMRRLADLGTPTQEARSIIQHATIGSVEALSTVARLLSWLGTIRQPVVVRLLSVSIG